MERMCGMETSPKAKATNMERIQKRALRIICPGKDYNEVALIESKLIPLKERRKHLCIDLIRNMVQPTHKLHGLLPDKHFNIKKRETRLRRVIGASLSEPHSLVAHRAQAQCIMVRSLRSL
jgi:hypothetical protein